MAIDLKDIQASIEDGLKKVKSEILAEVKEGGEKGAQALAKVDKVLEDLKELSKQEDLTKAKDEMQKQFDDALVEMKKEKGNGKVVTFKSALAEGLKAAHAEIMEKGKNRKLDTIIDLKDFNYTDFTGYEEFVTDFRQPILNPYASFHWRQIIPLGSTSKEFVKYPKESATGGAADTWEHAGDSATAKPQINPAIGTYQADVEWIAGLIKGIPVSMLEDLPWMTSYLQNKGINELMKAEDAQIMEGSGTSPDLDGFFTGSNSTAYDGSKTIFIEQIIDAAYRQVADSFFNANKAVISNVDKVSILLTEKSVGAGYGLPGGTVSVVNGTLNVAGLSIFSNPYLIEGRALVGDFNESQFVIRSAPRLRFFDQNATDAEKNQIMVRIEERVTLAIFHAGAFVKLVPGT